MRMTSFPRVGILGLCGVALLLAIDLGDDFFHGADLSHIALEGMAFSLRVGSVILLISGPSLRINVLVNLANHHASAPTDDI